LDDLPKHDCRKLIPNTKTIQFTQVIINLPLCVIYQKIQKNEEDPKVKKAKGLALFLAHDLGNE